MKFKELADTVFDGLTPTLADHSGVQLFAMEREKFDFWLRVELVRVLVQQGMRPAPNNKVNLAFGKWAVDVRTINTNIPHDACKAKGRQIKKEIDNLIKDIWRLTNPGKSITADNRAILFLAWPTEHENERWQTMHLNQVRPELTGLEFREFRFSGDIPGVLYFGLCSDMPAD